MKRCFIIAITPLMCLLALLSCSSNKTNKLIGQWILVTYTDPFKATLDPTTVSSDEIYTLRFHDTGFFSFTTDCNIISGEYALSGKQLQCDNISATQKACEKEIVERSVKCQLPMVKSYDFPNDSTLHLLGKSGNVLMKLIKVQSRQRDIDEEDECPFPNHTESEREPKFVFTITSDSLLACYNNFNVKDERSVILDTTNPGFPDILAQWIGSLDSVEASELLRTSALHITVGNDVSDASVDKVKRTVRNCGIEKFSISNFCVGK